MKNLFVMILFLFNTIVWTAVLIMRINAGEGWDALSVLQAMCAAINLIAALLNFFKFRKAREEKQAEKAEKTENKKRG